MKLLIAICLITVAAGREIIPNRVVPARRVQVSKTPEQRTLGSLPANVAVYDGEDVVFECSGVFNEETNQTYRIIWYEYVTNPNGNPISDGNYVLPGHPNAARYSIEQPTPDDFNLRISGVNGADGGSYACQDTHSNEPYIYDWQAELIVILAPPNCTNSLPANGIVLEDAYQQVECLVYFSGTYHPVMNFDGPPPFRSHSTNTSTSIWGGLDFNVDRSMDTEVFKVKTHFDDYFLPLPGGVSEVIPDWEHFYQTQQMFVYWNPKQMYVNGLKPENQVGDFLTCHADAFPSAFYSWQNIETLETWNSQGIQIPASFEGKTQRLRCQAQNIIQGFVYTNNTIVNVTVPAPTTTQSSTLPPTTTTPPAVSDCFDLTGHWESTDVKATLCLKVDSTQNGLTYGLIKNGTDTYYVEMYGRTDERDGQIGVAGVWPPKLKYGVASFVGECHRCYGVEKLFINSVARFSGGNCNAVGDVDYSRDYTFSRTSYNFDCMS